MKKSLKSYSIILFFVLLTIIARGQAVTITCGAPDFGCVANPNQTLHTFIATIASFTTCSNGNSCRFKWEVTNGIIVTNNSTTYEADGANIITVKWNNVNGIGSVKVTTAKRVSNLVGCENCPVGSTDTKNIPIKYLGTPGSIKINGVEYAGSYQLSCGKSPITVSVAPVTNATNYVWSYPIGWSQSGSGNTIILTPNAGLGGTIKVTASRSDVSGLTTSSQLNISRPTPSVPVINSGAILLCSPMDITASANNATSYSWVSTGGITASSPGYTNTAHLTGISDGTVKVSATSSVCAMTTPFSTPIQVKKSAPSPASLIVTENGGGSPDFMCNGSGVSLNAYTSEPGTIFGAWTVTDPANSFLNYSGGTAYFNSYINNCYGIDVTVSNCIGSTQKGITICVDNCLKDKPVYKVYPNPASDIINVTFDAAADIQSLPETIRVFSEATSQQVLFVDLKGLYSSGMFQADKTVSIPVEDLPRGTYYLHFGGPKKVSDKVRVVLE